MQGLNDKQREACSYTEGPLLILAGAGSGKTRVITHRIAYLINERGVNPMNILAITFTNKAANEMRERVDKIVDFGAESIWVSTFHSMCVRILRRFYEKIGGKNNFTIYDTDDQKTVIKEVLKSLNLDPKQFPERQCIGVISNAKENFLTPDNYLSNSYGGYREEQMAKIYAEYQRRLKANNALDFDDLIFNTLTLFEKEPEVLKLYQKRFKYIMVDEYQDTNHSQFLLVKYLAAGYRNLCVVGDDDQSIYKFRGANIYNILNFEEEYPDAKVVKLEQNYRSTQNILTAANEVIANNTGRKAKKLWTDNGEGERIQYTVYDSEYEEAMGVVNHIFQTMKLGYTLNDVAILYRTNAQSRVLEEKLLFSNLPYKIYGGTNFYSRKEIRDIVSYLKLMINTDDNVAFRRIINVPKRGIGATTIDKVGVLAEEREMTMYDFCLSEANISLLGRSGAKVKSFMDMMEKLRSQVDEISVTDLFDELMEATEIKILLQNEDTDEARTRVQNIEELRNKIVNYESNAEEPKLSELLEEISLVADADAEESDAEKVTLMTLHSAKGLEFPVVFMVGMEERLFPSGMSMDSDDPDAVEEERRLCYVGITRAQNLLYMSSAKSRFLNGNRIYSEESRFIREMPQELLKQSGGRPARVSNYRDSSDARTGVNYDDIASFGSSFGKSFGGSLDSIPGVSKGFGAGFKSKPYGAKAYGASKASSASSGFVLDYAVGDTVKHIKFGQGKVLELKKGGSDYEVTVAFDSVGEKKMFASLAKLKKL